MTTVQEVLDAARDGDSNFWTRSFEALQGRFDVHMAADDGMTSTLLAARNGHLKLLEFILANGGNPNDCEHYGGTCLMAAACFAHPECVRALVKAGADVTYAYAGDNANSVYMLALCFTGNLTKDADSVEASLQEHSAPWVRTLDLLLGYGAAPDQPSENRTALSLLQETHVDEDMPRTREERASLIALLRNKFWARRPQPLMRATAHEVQALLLTDDVCDPNTGHLSVARARSVDPTTRPEVLQLLRKQEEARGTFVRLVLPAAYLLRPRGCENLCLVGAIGPLLQLIAGHAGVPYGGSLRNLREATRVLESFEYVSVDD